LYLETSDHYSVTPSKALQEAVDGMFVEGTYFAKVDQSLPERAQRRWEKKSSDGGGDE
jgi:hypothetical protein